jgi:hypothetical protein
MSLYGFSELSTAQVTSRTVLARTKGPGPRTRATKPKPIGGLKGVALAMQDLIPVEVTALYLGLSGILTDPLAKLILPIGGLLTTAYIRYTQTDKRTLYDKKHKLRLGMVLIPVLAFVGWVYITGGNILNFNPVSKEVVAVIFGFLNIALPPVYKNAVLKSAKG